MLACVTSFSVPPVIPSDSREDLLSYHDLLASLRFIRVPSVGGQVHGWPTSSDRASVERCRSAPRRLPSGHFSTTFCRVRRRARRSASACAAANNADPALPDEHRLFRCRLLGRGRRRLPVPTAAVRKDVPVLATCANVWSDPRQIGSSWAI